MQYYFKKQIKINPERGIELSEFRNLEMESRPELTFEGYPKGFEVPSHLVYNNQSKYGIVTFELESRIMASYIPLGAEVERTDCLT
jgi:hypothetical protein